MKYKAVFLTVAVCLLVHVEVVSSRQLKCLSSYFQQYSNCGGGNLMRIFTNQCSNAGGKKQCKVKSTGTITTDPKTHFKIVSVGKRKCIQFKDTQDGGKLYALKAINLTNVVFEEQAQGCHSNINSQFLFEEALVTERGTKYTYRPENTTKCLASDCNGKLSLISTAVKKDRRCFFYRLLP